jgi:hypothetical protein
MKAGKLKSLWVETYTREFARILESYADRIILEVSGHEHLSDLRYSNGSVILNPNDLVALNKNSNLTGFIGPKLYHNMIITPGITSFDGSNPGFITFQLNLTSQIAYDMKQIFLDIQSTYGWQKPFPPVSQWPWRVVNMTEKYSINEITPWSIQ